jgi:elongation factor 1-gamma
MAMKLYTYKGNTKAMKSQIAALYNGVKVQTPKNFEMGKDNKDPEFLKMNPMGKVPVLETPEGCVFESNAIFRYVMRSSLATSLYGATPLEAAQVDQWIDWSANELELAIGAWVYPILGYAAFDFKATEKAQKDVQAALKVLDSYLETRTFLVGESVSGADIAVACALVNPAKLVFDAAFRKGLPNVFRWFTTCVNQPEFSAVLGAVELCTEAKTAKPAKKEQAKKEKKQEKPQEAKPAAEKKKKKKKEEDEEEMDIATEAAGPKVVWENPLDKLPKSSFVMDDWKRQYSNNDWVVAKEWLWANLDKEGYSCWICTYKYGADFQMGFNASNLAGGWIQRLDACRKYAMGSLNVVGRDKGQWNIVGAFIIRGNEDQIPEVFQRVDDCEHYVWEKVDYDNAAMVSKFEDLMAVEGPYFEAPDHSTESKDWKPFK